MDEELKHIADYFESWELCELLKVSTEDFIAAFEEDVIDKLAALEELMEYEHD